VVDNRFKVFGTTNLRVIDASSIPVLTNGHPMAVLVAMGERAADLIREDRIGYEEPASTVTKASKAPDDTSSSTSSSGKKQVEARAKPTP